MITWQWVAAHCDLATDVSCSSQPQRQMAPVRKSGKVPASLDDALKESQKRVPHFCCLSLSLDPCACECDAQQYLAKEWYSFHLTSHDGNYRVMSPKAVDSEKKEAEDWKDESPPVNGFSLIRARERGSEDESDLWPTFMSVCWWRLYLTILLRELYIQERKYVKHLLSLSLSRVLDERVYCPIHLDIQMVKVWEVMIEWEIEKKEEICKLIMTMKWSLLEDQVTLYV